MNGTQPTISPAVDPGSFGAPGHTAPPPVPPTAGSSGALPSQGLSDPRRRAPVLAGLLSFLPGLGQVYVGYYARGFAHAVIVGSLISILAAEVIGEGAAPLFALFLVFFWLYNVIDAARKASLFNLALDGIGTIELPQDFPAPGFRGSIAAGLLLIGIGGIFLSSTLFGLSLDWIEAWWPVAPIALGAWLLARGIQERSK
jgi:hypothetical protein